MVTTVDKLQCSTVSLKETLPGPVINQGLRGERLRCIETHKDVLRNKFGTGTSGRLQAFRKANEHSMGLWKGGAGCAAVESLRKGPRHPGTWLTTLQALAPVTLAGSSPRITPPDQGGADQGSGVGITR
eukprot:1148997-Pelagomonas_calceolata.AAC.2